MWRTPVFFGLLLIAGCFSSVVKRSALDALEGKDFTMGKRSPFGSPLLGSALYEPLEGGDFKRKRSQDGPALDYEPFGFSMN